MSAKVDPRIRVELDTARDAITVACSDRQRPEVRRLMAALPGGHRLADIEDVVVLVAAAGFDRHQRKRLTVEVARSVRTVLKLEGLL